MLMYQTSKTSGLHYTFKKEAKVSPLTKETNEKLIEDSHRFNVNHVMTLSPPESDFKKYVANELR